MAKIIGREREIAELKTAYSSDKAQLVAVYGRRRVGKTFLVDQALKGLITFRHAGLSPVDDKGEKNLLKEQLKAFYNSLLLQGMKKSRRPESWIDAFYLLETYLQSMDGGGRQLVFLDELPWMDTPRSGFIAAFESFWNGWACHRDNMMVVVCGSANSWIMDEFIDSHGGLYGRTTCEIRLKPFTLNECERFFVYKGIRMSRYDIAQSNMIFGGIPYYLDNMKKEKSLAQNVDDMLYSGNGLLRREFDRLFSSVFSNSEDMKAIVRTLYSKREGCTRSEISVGSGIDEGGNLSKSLKGLEDSDFILRYHPFGESRRVEKYKLIDPFCIFWLKFVSGHDSIDENFWLNNMLSQSVASWRGLAFETLCLRHISQIKAALGISGVVSRQSAWSIRGDGIEEGSQIDLLIERDDNVVNMCEMKFYSDEFAVNKNYSRALSRHIDALSGKLSPKQVIHSTLVTTFGLKYNEYSGIFQKVVTLDSLFTANA